MKLRYLLFLLGLLFLPRISLGAIAVDTSATSTQGSYVSSWTMPYTVTGANSYLYCSVAGYSNAGSYTTTATYNGVGMTKVYENFPEAGQPWQASAFTIANGTGDGASHNIVFTINGAQAANNYAECKSLTGVAQTIPEASSSNINNATVAVTTLTPNAWVIGGAPFANYFTGMGTNTKDAGNAYNQFFLLERTDNPIVTPASTTIAIQVSNTAYLSMWAASLAPASGAPTVTKPTRCLVGNGRTTGCSRP